MGKYAVCPVRALRGDSAEKWEGGGSQERTWFKHDGLFENPTAMGVELINTNWLAVQAEYVVKEGVSVSRPLASAFRNPHFL